MDQFSDRLRHRRRRHLPRRRGRDDASAIDLCASGRLRQRRRREAGRRLEAALNWRDHALFATSCASAMIAGSSIVSTLPSRISHWPSTITSVTSRPWPLCTKSRPRAAAARDARAAEVDHDQVGLVAGRQPAAIGNAHRAIAVHRRPAHRLLRASGWRPSSRRTRSMNMPVRITSTMSSAMLSEPMAILQPQFLQIVDARAQAAARGDRRR